MKTTIYSNIFAAIQADIEKEFQSFVSGLDKVKTVKELLSNWYYNELITASKKKHNWELQELKSYLIDRRKKADAKKIDAKLTHLLTVENSPELNSIDISIEWKKSAMWGSNPRATARVRTLDNGYNSYESGSIGGCGYDKQSTAVAEVVNQSNSLLKALYTVKDANVATNNRELFGYGSGSGILPRIEGGVGVSCYPAIFEKIGFKFKTVASGKTFDVYSISKP